MDLRSPIVRLTATKADTITKLHSVGIVTYLDLLFYAPIRYEDYGQLVRVDDAQDALQVTITGNVVKTATRYIRSNFIIFSAVVADETGTIECVWYNQRFLQSVIKVGGYVSISGVVKTNLKGVKQLMVNSYEVLKPNMPRIHTLGIRPVYSERGGISSRSLREKIYTLLQEINIADAHIAEYLPEVLRINLSIASYSETIKSLHMPKTPEEGLIAKERYTLDELLIMQLASYFVKKDWETQKLSHIFLVKKYKKKLNTLLNSLPYALTGAQQKVIDDIFSDVESDIAMNRFIQGDVGSGKTIVAAFASYICFLNGYTTLVMAPTEILAQQHVQTFTSLFAKLNMPVYLKTSSKKLKDLQVKYPCIIIGTHALITSDLDYKNVGLVIIDEQHRFGVKQRATLKEKGIHPHLLTMTATPIPRTVLLTMHGELATSVLNEMPKSRLPIKTFYVTEAKRASSYEWIKREIIGLGQQVFYVCPLVSESEHESMKDIKAVTQEYETLQKKVFPNFRIALLHGKMKPKEKDIIMQDFKDKKYDILVSTSVIEVGIDVPNATVIIIEGCERYGLSQLHQLRGRVGRGSLQSYCLLSSEKAGTKYNPRIEFFITHSSGLDLAEYDFKNRGPGDMFGVSQSGYSAATEAFSNMFLIEKAQKLKELIITKYPKVLQHVYIKNKLALYTDKISRD
jgi:ATP-dependent DNA helicase RecG